MNIERTVRLRALTRPSAPPPLKKVLRPYAALIVPAALAALLEWPWWLGGILLVPGLLLLISSGWMAADALGFVSRSETGQWMMVVICVPGAVVLGEFTDSHHKDYAALFFVCYLVIVVDPLWRFVWSRYRLHLRSGDLIGEARR